jgi:hypothetical protein
MLEKHDIIGDRPRHSCRASDFRRCHGRAEVPGTHLLFTNEKTDADTRSQGEDCGHAYFLQKANYGHGCQSQWQRIRACAPRVILL